VEARQNEQGQEIDLVFEAIQHLIEAPVEPKPAIQGRGVVLPFPRQYAIPNRTVIQSQMDAVPKWVGVSKRRTPLGLPARGWPGIISRSYQRRGSRLRVVLKLLRADHGSS